MTSAARRSSDLALVRRLLLHAAPQWRYILGYLLLSLVAAPIGLLQPLPLKLAVDSVLGDRPLPQLLAAVFPSATPGSLAALALVAAMVVAIAVASQLQEVSESAVRSYGGDRITLGFRARLFRHVQRLSLSYHDTRGSSDSLYRIIWDAPAVQYIAIDSAIPFFTAVVTLGAMTFVILQLDVQLAMVALAVIPVLIVLSRMYSGRLRERWREVKNLDSSAHSVVQEVLQSVRVVKAFGQEGREEKRFARFAGQGVRARVRFALFEGSFSLLIGVTTALGTAAVLFIGVRHVREGLLSLGDLLLVMGYLAQLFTPIRTIGKTAAALQGHLASAERAFALLDESPDVPEYPHARAVARAAGAVSFEDVSFAYESDRPILKGITFDVASGTRVGIAGTTGAGKTTLASLLSRFYDPTAGSIRLDGVDLREYRLADLRNQFAIVLQEPVLFSTSIAENIAYARPDAGEQQIVAAAMAANAHEFITALPDGYATVVGERGMKLSGGERQRIALARAFLRDAPVLVLDEPTSSVDVRTEATIMDAMERLMRGRTSFMIAHRTGTLAKCDLVLHMEDGVLVPDEVRDGVSVAPAGR